MTCQAPPVLDDVTLLLRLPGWISATRAEGPEDAAFLSGAALAQLHLAAGLPGIPGPLLRARLALKAAERCVGFAGRPERAGDLRDALLLMRPGDHPGPAGESYLAWVRAVGRPLSEDTLRRALPGLEAAAAAVTLAAGRETAMPRAAHVLEAALEDAPRAETAALIRADAALARGLGWSHVLPLLSLGLTRRELRLRGDDLRLACHRAAVAALPEVLGLAADLTRRTARLVAVAPKLRAKRAGEAVEMFLTRDALVPGELTRLMSDRAARRLCDRLVSLGAVRELSGRETFRVYGV